MLHDFRQRRAMMPTAEEAAALEWRECDADGAFSALLRFAPVAPAPVTAEGPDVQVTIRMNTMSTGPAPTNGWYFYGTQGTLVGEGTFTITLWQAEATGERKALPVPQRLLDTLPPIGDDYLNKWGALVQEFVADIRGEPHEPYLTFGDGWRYQEAIDTIRAGRGWRDLPKLG
jgi:hypothetical protein